VLDSDEREKVLDTVACATESFEEERGNAVAAWAESEDVDDLDFVGIVDFDRYCTQQLGNAEVAGSCRQACY
jgi:hypothetical protein